MRVLVIGGHTRNIGKTALVCDVIRAFPEAAWVAVKITQYGHGVCSVNGEQCGCAPQEHPYSLDEERNRNNRTDTSRFLVAGAHRSLWLRTKQGQLAAAMPELRAAIRDARNVIIESNSVLHFLRPELYVTVLDPRQDDFKDSARRFLDSAAACVLRSPLGAGGSKAPLKLVAEKPQFVQPLGEPLPAGLRQFIAENFFGAWQ